MNSLLFVLLMSLVCAISMETKRSSGKQVKEVSMNKTGTELKSLGFGKLTNISSNIVYAALVTDLQVISKVLGAPPSRKLSLIVTWKIPTSGRAPESFNLHVQPLNESQSCGYYPYYAYIDDPRAVSWTVLSEALDSIQINSHCSYNVTLESNPHNGKESRSTVYTVPECVEGLCSCLHQDLLPLPEVKATIISKETLNITWVVKPNNYLINVTKSVIGFGKMLIKSASHRNVYNLSWVSDVKFKQDQLFYSHPVMLSSSGDYMVAVFLKDQRGCHGPMGNYTLLVIDPLDPAIGTFSKTEIFWMVILPSASFLLATCVAVTMLGHRVLSWLKKRNLTNDMGMIPLHNNHVKSSYKPISINSNRPTKTNFPLHQERNILYVEKEIEEARARGEADAYEIGYSRLTFGREIGKGAFGRVFIAEAEAIAGHQGVMTVAVKKLKNRVSADELEEFQAEISMMKRVGRHANIVTMLGCCTLKQPFCMIMEYVPCGDLLQYLRRLRQEYSSRRRTMQFTQETGTDSSYVTPNTPQTVTMSLSSGGPSLTSDWSVNKQPPFINKLVPQLEYVLDPRELQSFAVQIARGMAYLESKQITHRDLAARNILIDTKKVLKISDFGLSRSGIYVNTKKKKVPLRWLSVEAMRDSLYSSKSDVWAFGIVLWEIGTLGGFPYPTVMDYDLLNFLLQGKRLEKPENFSPELYSLMTVCWSFSADDRPYFSDIVSHLDKKHRQQVYVDFRPDHQFPPTEEMLKITK